MIPKPQLSDTKHIVISASRKEAVIQTTKKAAHGESNKRQIKGVHSTHPPIISSKQLINRL
jgi:hypothetical protein